MLWQRRFFFESFRGTAGPLSFLLDTQYHATRLAHLLAVHNFSLDSPAIVFCLPQSCLASLMCRRAGKYGCLFSVSASECTLEKPLRFWLQQTFHHLNIHFHLGASFQIIFRCIHHFFLMGSSRLSAVPGLLATILHLQIPTNLVSMALFGICPISTTQPPGNSGHPS